MSNPKSKADQLAQLKKVWYARLKEDGFEDIETRAGTIRNRFTDGKQSSKHALSRFAKADYHELATRFLNTYDFETGLDRVMWEYHVEGISYRNIAKILSSVGLNKHYQKNLSKDYVMRRIKPLKTEMLKRYLIK